MASSLSDHCTPLKREYDSCFNAWFEGYLEPAVSATPAERLKHSQDKAEEYEAKCGKIWSQYQACVQVRRSPLVLGRVHSRVASLTREQSRKKALRRCSSRQGLRTR